MRWKLTNQIKFTRKAFQEKIKLIDVYNCLEMDDINPLKYLQK